MIFYHVLKDTEMSSFVMVIGSDLRHWDADGLIGTACRGRPGFPPTDPGGPLSPRTQCLSCVLAAHGGGSLSGTQEHQTQTLDTRCPAVAFTQDSKAETDATLRRRGQSRCNCLPPFVGLARNALSAVTR